MARGRIILESLDKSERFNSALERLAEADPAGRLPWIAGYLYQRLGSRHDDFGRGSAQPFDIRSAIFWNPRLPVSDAEIETCLAALAGAGIIALYEANGKRYYALRGSDAAQVGLHKRTHSTFPPPPEADGFAFAPGETPSGKFREIPGNSGKFPEFREIPAQPNLTQPNLTQPNLTQLADHDPLVDNPVKNLDQEKPITPASSEEDSYRLAGLLCSHVRKIYPKTPKPNRDKWAGTIALMLRGTESHPACSPQEIERVIAWLPHAPVKGGDFSWGKVIRSPDNLRQHFPVLLEECRGAGRRRRSEPSDFSSKKEGWA